jgi:hypothetical protein
MANINIDAPVRSRSSNGRKYLPEPRSPGLVGQLWMVLLRPGAFFQSLPPLRATRQWVWIAAIVLALSGYSAVRRDSLRETVTGDLDTAGDVGTGGEGFTPSRGGESGDPFGGPLPSTPPDGSTTAKTDVTEAWSTGLVSASRFVLEWLVLAVLLCEVSLLNGSRPRFGKNLQIAIWASVPLGLMAGLQLVFYAAGGKVGEDGLSGLLPEWDGYVDLPKFQRSVVLALATRTTLFWLWNLILIYFGARYSLRGKWVACVLVLAAWVTVLAVVPVATGDIEAKDGAAVTDTLSDEGIPGDLSPERDFSGEVAPDGTFMPNGGSEATGEGVEMPADEGAVPEGKQETTPDATAEANMPAPARNYSNI